MLFELKDNEEEAKIAAEVMRDLVCPAPCDHNLPNLTKEVQEVFADAKDRLADSPDFPLEWINVAEDALQECSTIDQADAVLHGDLHHGNIIYDETRGWIAIDPMGFVEPPQLEIGRFSFNFLPGLVEEIEIPFRVRMSILSEKLEDDQVYRWAMVDVMRRLVSTIGKKDDDRKTYLLKGAKIITSDLIN